MTTPSQVWKAMEVVGDLFDSEDHSSSLVLKTDPRIVEAHRLLCDVWVETKDVPVPVQDHFKREDDGSRTCVDCDANFPRCDGGVMRAHRRRIHGDHYPIPKGCDA